MRWERMEREEREGEESTHSKKTKKKGRKKEREGSERCWLFRYVVNSSGWALSVWKGTHGKKELIIFLFVFVGMEFL